MRSRDGNCTFALRFSIIFFVYSLALNAGEYLISYRYVVKDALLYNDSLLISKAMVKCNTKAAIPPLILPNDGEKNLKKIISKNHQRFVKYIHKLGLDVKSTQTTSNMQNTSTTIITLKTRCFKVDFNDNFAKITPLK